MSCKGLTSLWGAFITLDSIQLPEGCGVRRDIRTQRDGPPRLGSSDSESGEAVGVRVPQLKEGDDRDPASPCSQYPKSGSYDVDSAAPRTHPRKLRTQHGSSRPWSVQASLIATPAGRASFGTPVRDGGLSVALAPRGKQSQRHLCPEGRSPQRDAVTPDAGGREW